MKELMKRFNIETIQKKIKNVDFNALIRNYYGIFLLVATEAVLALILIFFGDKMYIASNDNLDSNVVLMKMFRDNHCWIDRTTPIPFLGGINRDILTCDYSLQYINYWLFDTQFAYWMNFLESIALSAVGFYYLGRSCRLLTGKNISPNVFCVGGILYSLVGFWPHAIIGFAMIPWWAYLTLEVYRTKKWWVSLFFVLLLYNISGPLIGIFLLFYTFIFYLAVTIKERKINRELTVMLGVIVSAFLFFIRHLFRFMGGAKDTIKSLTSGNGITYSASVSECLKELKNVLLLNSNGLYHSGVVSLRKTALPLLFVFLIVFNAERKKLKIGKEFLIIYNSIVAAYVFNAVAVAFDYCGAFRKLIPFLSGFSFSRFIWLSPFILVIGFLMILYFLCKKKLKRTSAILVLFVLYGIISTNNINNGSLYNNISVNYNMNIRHHDLNDQVRWKDYYKLDLFETIKKDLDYNGEWVVAYAFDPSILQYNGFKTLDGYYSNYSLDYKNKWEKMIMPTLLSNSFIMNYWQGCNGQRAYIFTPRYGYMGNDTEPMLIEPTILEELGGTYVISRVKIENCEELGFAYVDTWNDNSSDYIITVYKIGSKQDSN